MKEVYHYYQEVGRAGRDGLPAECLMLYSARTVIHHLAEQITLGIDLDINQLVAPHKQEAIHQVIARVGCEKLSPIKNALPADFTYEEISLVAAFHRRVKNTHGS